MAINQEANKLKFRAIHLASNHSDALLAMDVDDHRNPFQIHSVVIFFSCSEFQSSAVSTVFNEPSHAPALHGLSFKECFVGVDKHALHHCWQIVQKETKQRDTLV